MLRLKDVADVELGDEYYNYSSEVNGHPAAMMMINQKAGSNASSTINEIHEVLDDIKGSLPEGAEFVVLTDTNKFLYASIHSVIRTLLEAILLVGYRGVCIPSGYKIDVNSHNLNFRFHNRHIRRHVANRLLN